MSPVLHVLGDTHASGASEVAPTPCPTRLMTLAPSKVPLPAERIRGVRWSVRGPLRFSVLIYQSKSPPDSCILASGRCRMRPPSVAAFALPTACSRPWARIGLQCFGRRALVSEPADGVLVSNKISTVLPKRDVIIGTLTTSRSVGLSSQVADMRDRSD